jgi:regulator of protease activity HflC (stomatin/prohibitin superfamily)
MKGMTMNSKTLIRISAVCVLLLLLAVAKPFVIVRAGTVGVVYSFGSIVGQVDEGFHLIWPWWFVTHTDIKVQRAVLDKLPSFSARSGRPSGND